jgi:hypothetical protein
MDCRNDLDREAAWIELRPLGFGAVAYLRDAYSGFASWEGRTALVYYATRYARISEDAIELGCMALHDRSYMVRYRACGLLAYSLRKDRLAELQELVRTEKRDLVRESAQAAIIAIRGGNHHLYVDRDRSGRSFWEVNPGDRPHRAHPASFMDRVRSIFDGSEKR